MRMSFGFYTLLLIVVFVIGLINPIREMMTHDGWAYALSVRHLLATSEYRLHDWAAANMPVQIYWAAFLARILGYTFIVLRLSTLVLLLVALISFYWLLRYSGIADHEASLLTLAMVASPVVLFLSFTFQTDVHFLGWQIAALLLYAMALRNHSYLIMALASIAAAAAVGTRQFGAALVAGLVATWFITEPQRTRKAPLYLIGLILPVLATWWQFSFGVSRPTFSQQVRLAEQVAYMRNVPGLIADFCWRPAIILQYLVAYLLPLLPLLVLISWKACHNKMLEVKSARFSLSFRALLGLGICTTYVVMATGFVYFFYWPRVLMPYLAWLLPHSQTSDFGFKKHLALTVLTSAFAGVLAWHLMRRYLLKRNWGLTAREEWFITFSAIALLGLQLMYTQFYDVYLIQFLPFALFALGRIFGPWSNWAKAITCALCMFMLFGSSLWTRGNLARAEASWRAAELAHSAGAAPENIGGDMTWSCYYGAFDEWIATIGGLDASGRYIGSNRMHFAFFDFLHKRYAQTKYLLTSGKRDFADPTRQLLGTVEYRDGWLHNRSIYVLRTSE
jgi:hypothetical protein